MAVAVAVADETSRGVLGILVGLGRTIREGGVENQRRVRTGRTEGRKYGEIVARDLDYRHVVLFVFSCTGLQPQASLNFYHRIRRTEYLVWASAR